MNGAFGRLYRDAIYSNRMRKPAASRWCGLYFILDEPMSGLDPKARALLKRQFAVLKLAGKTLFLSSHVLADVEEICDRMAILHEGKLRFIGTPAECRAQYQAENLESAYLAAIA